MRLLLDQAARMLAETRQLDALAAEVDWLARLNWTFTSAGDVCVEFDITLDSRLYEAVLIYPNLFPQAPAFVRPRKDGETWSVHQYPSSGTLCLEWGPDTWHPAVTGADLVRSTHKLLSFNEQAAPLGIAAPSRHELTVGQRLRGEALRFVVTREFAQAIAAAGPASMTAITVSTSIRFKELVAFATEWGADEKRPLGSFPPELTDSLGGTAVLRSGWLVRCKSYEGLSAPMKSQAEVREFLQAQNLWPWSGDELVSGFLLLADDKNRLRAMCLAKGDGQTAFEYRALDLGTEDSPRQPLQYQDLAGKRVAIIGLGSVGSKIAVSLARAGVCSFVLVDDDILAPSNLSRNQLDWLSVGYDKVDGVSGAIRLVKPEAEVQTRTFRFAGQESSSSNSTVLEQVAACDLVIDATASANVFSSLAAICSRRGVTLIWGEMFAGGIGGLMARSIPGVDADPLNVRAAINAYLETLPEAPYKRAQGYDVENGDAVLIAGDPEVSHLAASMTQFAIDALLPSARRKFPVAAYLLGYQQAWVFEAPFDTRAIQCPPAAESSQVGADAAPNLSDLTELAKRFNNPDANGKHSS